jgi:hypothetical protein
MNPEDLQNITYRRQRYRSREPIPDREETEAQPERDKGKGTMEDQDKAAFNNLISALSDLARGQKEVLAAINRLADKPGVSQNNLSNNVEGGSNNGNGSHARTTMQSHPHLHSRTPRPTIPQFLDSPTIGKVVQAEQDELFGAYFLEYKALGDDFHSTMSFAEFCNIKSMNRSKGFNRAFN